MKKICLSIVFFIIFGNALKADEAKKIISLGPTLTEQVFLLGAGDMIVGDTTYCTHPKEAEYKPKIGNVIDINIEKILSLKPDIILATELTDKKQLATLEQLGFKDKTIMFTDPTSYKEICSQFIKLGKIVDKTTEAEQIVAKSEKDVATISKNIEKMPKTTVFVEIGTNPLFAATGNTFIGNLIKFAGGINVAENASQGIYSREKVVESKPEVIIISNMGNESQTTASQEWDKFKTIPAVKNNRVYLIDSYTLCSPNPATYPSLLNEVANMLHPELKRDK